MFQVNWQPPGGWPSGFSPPPGPLSVKRYLLETGNFTPIRVWLTKIRESSTMEEIITSTNHREDQYNKIWFYWHDFSTDYRALTESS